MKSKLVSVLAALGAVLALLLLAPAALHAQDDRRGMGMGMGAGACPMAGQAGCPAFGPEAALSHRDALALGSDQVAALETLADAVRQQRAAMASQMRSARDRIDAATAAERFDEAALRRELETLADLHTETALVMLRAQHDTRQVLNDSQEQRLRGLAPQRPMRGIRGGDAECPMMNGQGGAAPPPR